MRLPFLAIGLLACLPGAASAARSQADIESLFPIPENVRTILDLRCVMCHGEIIDGEPEIRENLDLSTDEKIRETLFSVATLIEVIEENEMPHDARLSFRLRRQPEMQERLKQIIAAYDENEEREILLAWLNRAAGSAND